jgi:hypothetical protein
VAAAGVLLAARALGVDLGLEMPCTTAILLATGAGRSRAYEVCDELRALLPSLVRPPGRPPKPPQSPAPDVTHALRKEVLRFVLDHPGCVHGGAQRRRYSGTFRRFVLELVERHAELSLAALSEAIAVPLGTLEAWLRPGPLEESAEPAERPVRDATVPKVETLLDAWRRWDGDVLAPFGEHVRRDLHLDFGNAMIGALLFDYGERVPKRRPGRSPDEEALRGAFETFFPGAQWVGDGTEVEVLIDGEVFRLTLELMVDAHSGAWVGLEVRDAEDSAGVIDAFEAGVETTGAPPLAVLLDNHPCNHTEEVDAALGDTMRIRATPFRPQNKAHVEGTIGLFAQRAPELVLDTDSPRQLAHQIARLVAVVFACAFNRRPRRDRDGKSRAQLYGEPVTEEQRREAKHKLRARLRKQERARQTHAARLDPVVRERLDRAFERLDLDDPERHFRDAIARYPLDSIVDGIGIFEGKSKHGSLPDGADARYLLGIVRNLDARHEADTITRALLDERLAAHDALLQPLVRRQGDLTRLEFTEHLRHLVDEAMGAERALERHFWLGVLAGLVRQQPEGQRRERFRAAARRIHSSFRVHRHDRDAAERVLARLIWPLA